MKRYRHAKPVAIGAAIALAIGILPAQSASADAAGDNLLQKYCQSDLPAGSPLNAVATSSGHAASPLGSISVDLVVGTVDMTNGRRASCAIGILTNNSSDTLLVSGDADIRASGPGVFAKGGGELITPGEMAAARIVAVQTGPTAATASIIGHESTRHLVNLTRTVSVPKSGAALRHAKNVFDKRVAEVKKHWRDGTHSKKARVKLDKAIARAKTVYRNVKKPGSKIENYTDYVTDGQADFNLNLSAGNAGS